ncbi:hypothetical protein NMG60_11025940 [Bertholletia excelsa]
MAKKATKSKEGTLSRCLKAPFRFLGKFRDLYINSMTQCAGRVECGGAMGGPGTQISTQLPRNFSVSSERSTAKDEDLAELIRIASTRSLGNKVELELHRRQQQSQKAAATGMPRSQTVGIGVGIGRIDEDAPCEFGDVKVNAELCPRSRSYAVSKRP